MLWISLPAEHEGSALLWLWIIYAEGVNCHGFDLLFVKWSVAVVSVSLSNLVYHIHALGHFTKSSVSTIKVWSILCMMKNWLPAESGCMALAMERTPSVCFNSFFTPF